MNNLRLIFQIAWTQLMARKRQTLTATVGVTFGMVTFVFLSASIMGMNDVIQTIMMDNTPHIRLFNEPPLTTYALYDLKYKNASYLNVVSHVKPKTTDPVIRNAAAIIQHLKQDSRIAGVAASVTSRVFYQYGSIRVNGNLTGTVVDDEDKLFELRKKVISGDINRLSTDRNTIMIGQGLAKNLNVGVHDYLQIIAPGGRKMPMKIVAVYKALLSEANNSQSYSSLPTIQKLMGKDNTYVTTIKVKLNEPHIATPGPLAAKLEKQLTYRAEDWQTANKSLIGVIGIQNTMLYVVSGAILFVAGFGIYNMLTLMIYSRIKEIAILKAIGFRGKDVTLLFLSQSLIIGILGGFLGLAIGFLISYAVSVMPYEQTEFYTIDHFPMRLSLAYFFSGLIFSLLTAFFAGFSPARKAARTDPVAIIRE